MLLLNMERNRILLCIFLVIACAILGFTQELKTGKNTFNRWQRNCDPVMKYYFYNWTNPEAINDRSVKPDFDEVGPYTFSFCNEKTNLVWHENCTVSYTELTTWWFEPDQSNGTLDDIITSVNVVAANIGDYFRSQNNMMRQIINTALEPLNVKIYVSVPVGKLLFDGYDDPILNSLNNMTLFGQKLPEKFAHFYGVNATNTTGPVYNMNTGICGQLGEIRSWYSQTDYPMYSDNCNNFDGASAGDFFRSNLTKYDTIKVFDANLCRTFEYEFQEEVTLFNGTIGNKYKVGDQILDNGGSTARNKCFSNDDCVYYGVINVGRCMFGPVYVSLPHFYKAHPYYFRALGGMKKSPEHDNVYITLHKALGIPVEYQFGWQVNIRLRPIENITLFENLPDVFFPLYYEQRVLANYYSNISELATNLTI